VRPCARPRWRMPDGWSAPTIRPALWMCEDSYVACTMTLLSERVTALTRQMKTETEDWTKLAGRRQPYWFRKAELPLEQDKLEQKAGPLRLDAVGSGCRESDENVLSRRREQRRGRLPNLAETAPGGSRALGLILRVFSMASRGKLWAPVKDFSSRCHLTQNRCHREKTRRCRGDCAFTTLDVGRETI